MADVDVSSSRCAGRVVVALRGELDVMDAAELPRVLSAAAPGSQVIVDLTGLAFMDCSSLSALLSARRQALQAGGDLLLAAPRGSQRSGFFPSSIRTGCCRCSPAWNRRPAVPGGPRRPTVWSLHR
jgi:anti-anti-sigma factor